MKLSILGARVIDPTSQLDQVTDLHLEAGKIIAIGAAPSGFSPVESIDAKGLVAAAINPKVVLFFLSFLPQFVVATRGDANLQIGVLGIVFTLQAAVIFGLLGYFSGTIGGWLNRTPTAGMWLDRIAGAVFIGLGLRLIVAR